VNRPGASSELLACLVPEQALQALLAGQLGHDRAQAAAGREQPERGRDRRLAHAALAGDEHQALIQNGWHRTRK
jgi:hypothetical protein